MARSFWHAPDTCRCVHCEPASVTRVVLNVTGSAVVVVIVVVVVVVVTVGGRDVVVVTMGWHVPTITGAFVNAQ